MIYITHNLVFGDWTRQGPGQRASGGIVNLSHFQMITTRNVGNKLAVGRHQPHGMGTQTRDEFQRYCQVNQPASSGIRSCGIIVA
jgi:hypothetical protein